MTLLGDCESRRQCDVVRGSKHIALSVEETVRMPVMKKRFLNRHAKKKSFRYAYGNQVKE